MSDNASDQSSLVQIEPVEEAQPTNKRPESVAALILDRDTGSGWFSNAWQQNRFFIVNLELVMGMVRLHAHTAAGSFTTEAARVIKEKTDWQKEFGFEYACHPRHFSKEKRFLPKYFGHAVTMIVALEVAASKLETPINVYDHLRILPAQYFVDLFDEKRLARISAQYDAMKPAERAAKFGDEMVDYTFEQLCLKAMRQPKSEGLLEEIAKGACLTKQPAELLNTFINEHFDRDVGPVLSSGAEGGNRKLGSKGAAKSLRVPQMLQPVPACF